MPDRDRHDDFGLKWIGERTGTAERRQVVVLAIGFDPVPAADLEDIAGTLGRRRTLVRRLATRYGGTVERADPDLQLVCWGWPVSHEADARLAVAAALEIAGDATAFARCGLDAGIAISPGLRPLPDDDGLVCEALNSAVGYRAAAAQGQVVVSDTVCELVDGFFERGTVQPLASGQRAWTLSHLPAGSARQRHSIDLIGRTAEIARLEDCWREVLRGGSGMTCIEGEAGMGKSALATRLARLTTETGGRFVALGCLPERQQQPGWIVDQLCQRLSNLLQLSPDETEGQRAAGPQGRLLHELVTRAATQWPLAVIVANSTWIDAASAEAVARLHQIPRVLLLETRRPSAAAANKSSAMPPPPGAHLIELEPMSVDHIKELVRRSAPGERLSPTNLRLVCDQAEGNPFYALELARLCAERPDANSHHRLLSTPNRLNAHLTGRLDALTDLKPLAQAAAVLGRLFDASVLAAVLEIEPRALTERLELLVQTGILSARPSRRSERYRFKHALIWSQAYGSVLKSRRRGLHLKMAAELTRRFDAGPHIRAEFVAHHWKKAGRPAMAFEWWHRAARDAAVRGADAASIDCINEALAAKTAAPQACSPAQEAALMSLLARQQHALRGRASPEAISAYETAMSLLAATTGEVTNFDLDIAWGLASIHLVRGDIKGALHASSKLIGEAVERGRPDIQVMALRIHGTANLLAGRVGESIEVLNAAVQLRSAVPDDSQARFSVCDPTASALAHLSSAHAIAGNGAMARQIRREALARAAAVQDAHTSSNILGVLALGAMHLDETGIAAALARASEEVATPHNYRYWAARAALIQAAVATRRAPGRAMNEIRAAIDVYRTTGAGRASVIAHCLVAGAAIDARLPAEAITILTPFRNKGHLQGEWIYIPELLRLEATAIAMQTPTRRDEAMQLLSQAEAMSLEHGSVAFLHRIRATLARMESTKSGRSTRARKAIVAAA